MGNKKSTEKKEKMQIPSKGTLHYRLSNKRLSISVWSQQYWQTNPGTLQFYVRVTSVAEKSAGGWYELEEKNLPTNFTSQGASSSNITPQEPSNSSKPVEKASTSGIPPAGASISRKAYGGRGQH
jgi:hypothetical protein